MENFNHERIPSFTSLFSYDGHDYATTVQLTSEDIKGKVMLCGGILIEWDQEMLMSKVDD